MLLDDLTHAVLHLQAFDARVLFRELLSGAAPISELEAPRVSAPLELALAASLAEWLAAQREESPPAWATKVPASSTRVLLVTVKTERKLHRLIEETPEPFRRRNFVAPEGFLTVA